MGFVVVLLAVFNLALGVWGRLGAPEAFAWPRGARARTRGLRLVFTRDFHEDDVPALHPAFPEIRARPAGLLAQAATCLRRAAAEGFQRGPAASCFPRRHDALDY